VGGDRRIRHCMLPQRAERSTLVPTANTGAGRSGDYIVMTRRCNDIMLKQGTVPAARRAAIDSMSSLGRE